MNPEVKTMLFDFRLTALPSDQVPIFLLFVLPKEFRTHFHPSFVDMRSLKSCTYYTYIRQ
jgi:hypothetical protein